MRIVIILEGGLVRDIWTDLPECECAVIDLDVADLQPDRITKTPHGQDCYFHTDEVGYGPEYVAQVFGMQGLPGVPPDLVLDMAAALAEIIASHDNWRDCSDMREALAVWTETVNKARRVINRVTGVDHEQEDPSNG